MKARYWVLMSVVGVVILGLLAVVLFSVVGVPGFVDVAEATVITPVSAKVAIANLRSATVTTTATRVERATPNWQATAKVAIAQLTKVSEEQALPSADNTSIPISDGICRLDKIGTWSEIEGAGSHRIEVGGHGGQHVDFYPARGVMAVSYIVPSIADPNGVPAIWNGFGSIWEGNGVACLSFNYVVDATGYAKARLDSGHSGIVVDLRSGIPQVVANVANLDQSEVVALLALHAEGQGGLVEVIEEIVVDTADQESVVPASPAGTCLEGDWKDRVPKVNEPFHFNPNKEWVIVNFWSNQTDPNYSEHKLLLSPDENPALLGGGAYWSWSSECTKTVQGNYEDNSNPPVSLSELRAMNFIR